MECNMSFTDFPFDKQLCPIRLESFAHSDTDLVVNWDQGESIDYNGQLHMADFILTKKFIRNSCTAKYKTGNFRQLREYINFIYTVQSTLYTVYTCISTCIRYSLITP